MTHGAAPLRDVLRKSGHHRHGCRWLRGTVLRGRAREGPALIHGRFHGLRSFVRSEKFLLQKVQVWVMRRESEKAFVRRSSALSLYPLLCTPAIFFEHIWEHLRQSLPQHFTYEKAR